MNATPSAHRRATRITVAAALSAMLVAGCSTKAEDSKGKEGAGGIKGGPGVTDTTIKIGSLTDLTGPYATLGESITNAQKMWADEVNADGGICERKIEITVKDHGYDVQKAVAAYSEVAPDSVALSQVIGSPVVAALVDDIGKDQILTYPQAWSASLLGIDPVQVTGTTYDVDMIAGVDFLTRTKGIAKGDKIGHVYFEGDYGSNALEGSTWAAGKAGVEIVEQKIKPTDQDLSAQVAALQKAKVKAILISAGPAQTASLVGVAASRGLQVPVVSNIPGYSPQLMASEAAPALEGMLHMISAAPAVNADIPGVKDMVAKYQKAYPKAPVDTGVLSGYNAAQLLGLALEKACENGSLAREDIVKAHRQLADADTGLGTPQNFSNVKRPASVENYVLKPSKDALGGAEIVEEPRVAPGVEEYLKEKGRA
ncbi:ABC transporter substrate-binding protein [Streptomyces sp. NPDC002644]